MSGSSGVTCLRGGQSLEVARTWREGEVGPADDRRPHRDVPSRSHLSFTPGLLWEEALRSWVSAPGGFVLHQGSGGSMGITLEERRDVGEPSLPPL